MLSSPLHHVEPSGEAHRELDELLEARSDELGQALASLFRLGLPRLHCMTMSSVQETLLHLLQSQISQLELQPRTLFSALDKLFQ